MSWLSLLAVPVLVTPDSSAVVLTLTWLRICLLLCFDSLSSYPIQSQSRRNLQGSSNRIPQQNAQRWHMSNFLEEIIICSLFRVYCTASLSLELESFFLMFQWNLHCCSLIPVLSNTNTGGKINSFIWTNLSCAWKRLPCPFTDVWSFSLVFLMALELINIFPKVDSICFCCFWLHLRVSLDFRKFFSAYTHRNL